MAVGDFFSGLFGAFGSPPLTGITAARQGALERLAADHAHLPDRG